jgi:hypothetical protein
MKRPRFSISRMMAVILIVALDFWIGRALMNAPLFGPGSELIVFGALPMTGILAIGLLFLFKSKDKQGHVYPALVGFEVFGGSALLLFIGSSLMATRAIHEGVGSLVRAMHISPGPMFAMTAATLVLLPQVALALFGGWLCGRYTFRLKVIIERRRTHGLVTVPIADRLVIVQGVSR